MGKISSYSTSTPVLTDKLIGTDVGGSPTDSTKNFLLSDIQTLFKSGIALSDVLAAGNTATANIVLTGDITASGTITGATVTATGVVNAVTVNASATIVGSTIRATSIAKELGGVSLSVDGTDLIFNNIPVHADNNAAKVGAGMPNGGVYITDGTAAAPLNVAGILMIVV